MNLNTEVIDNESEDNYNSETDIDFNENRDQLMTPKKNRKKRINCNKCPKRFLSKCLLTAHQYKHSDEYLCNECGFRAISPSNLVTHKRKHSNDRPFVPNYLT